MKRIGIRPRSRTLPRGRVQRRNAEYGLDHGSSASKTDKTTEVDGKEIPLVRSGHFGIFACGRHRPSQVGLPRKAASSDSTRNECGACRPCVCLDRESDQMRRCAPRRAASLAPAHFQRTALLAVQREQVPAHFPEVLARVVDVDDVLDGHVQRGSSCGSNSANPMRAPCAVNHDRWRFPASVQRRVAGPRHCACRIPPRSGWRATGTESPSRPRSGRYPVRGSIARPGHRPWPSEVQERSASKMQRRCLAHSRGASRRKRRCRRSLADGRPADAQRKARRQSGMPVRVQLDVIANAAES